MNWLKTLLGSAAEDKFLAAFEEYFGTGAELREVPEGLLVVPTRYRSSYYVSASEKAVDVAWERNR